MVVLVSRPRPRGDVGGVWPGGWGFQAHTHRGGWPGGYLGPYPGDVGGSGWRGGV